jgi:taurine dioxygenase
MKITALDAPCGAEITGLEIEDPVDDETVEALKAAQAAHAVLVFRDQRRLTPERQIAFSRRFGPLQIHVQKRFHLPGHPEILVVSNEFRNGEPIGLVDAGHYWHSDLSYMAKPSLGSMLHAQIVPEDSGDTLFADQRAAYDALPPDLKRRLAGLIAEHSYLARNQRQAAKSSHRPNLDPSAAATVPPVVHPVVRRHPASGRPALFVSEGFTTRILDLAEGQSADLLADLYAHSVEPRFVYRHRWRPHDMVFWDNRAVMHFATGCPPDVPRTLYRTTIEGDVPVPYGEDGGI